MTISTLRRAGTTLLLASAIALVPSRTPLSAQVSDTTARTTTTTTTAPVRETDRGNWGLAGLLGLLGLLGMRRREPERVVETRTTDPNIRR